MSAGTPSPDAPLARLAAVVVTYHPDMARLERLLAGVPDAVAVVVVDNGSGEADVAAIERQLSGRARARLLRNPGNAGLAAAINQGVAAAGALDVDFLLLLDQDSVPRPNSIAALLAGFLWLEGQGRSVGCVGPVLIDNATRLRHGFHCIRGIRWVRVFPSGPGSAPVACANINGSGTLMRRELFERLGGLDEAFFIDHVDTDWAFRIAAAGYGLFGIPGAEFEHAMGERSLRAWWFGWRVWPCRTPDRHYYLFRNAMVLLQRDYVPRVWKAWALAKLAATLAVHGIADRERARQLRSMVAGLRAGLRRA